MRAEPEPDREWVAMIPHHEIEETIVTAAGPQGERLAVVLLKDGHGYAITRNGEFGPAHHWPSTQLDACIAVFLRISGLSADTDH